ncbi:MAG: bifunctional folylpolyglutamate synthase/dihydrofolate synthase, partial [Nitrospiraceae bacterium]
MTYQASLEFLYGLQKHGIKLGLETIQSLLAGLGNPQHHYPALHIGG